MQHEVSPWRCSRGLSDEELASLLQQQEDARHREMAPEHEVSGSSASSGSPTPTPRLARMALRAIGPNGGRHVRVRYPAVGGPGCFGAVAGACGGSVLWALGCANMVCFCVAAGALAEQMLRHTQYRHSTRWGPGSDEDSSSEDDIPLGLDAEAIERTTRVSTVGHAALAGQGCSDGSDISDEHCKCMICFELFSKGDALRILPCLHRYHRTCIDEWLRRSCRCPICKHDVTETVVQTCSTNAARREGGRARTSSGSFMSVRFRRRPWSRGASRPSPAAPASTSGSLQFRDALERTSR